MKDQTGRVAAQRVIAPPRLVGALLGSAGFDQPGRFDHVTGV